MLTKENSGVTKETPAASREGRTVFVDADSRYAGRDRPDVTDGIDGDLHRFTESLGRDVFRPQTIPTARYP